MKFIPPRLWLLKSFTNYPQKSREEIEAMLGLSDLKQTKVYQEALAEGEHRGEVAKNISSDAANVPRVKS